MCTWCNHATLARSRLQRLRCTERERPCRENNLCTPDCRRTRWSDEPLLVYLQPCSRKLHGRAVRNLSGALVEPAWCSDRAWHGAVRLLCCYARSVVYSRLRNAMVAAVRLVIMCSVDSMATLLTCQPSAFQIRAGVRRIAQLPIAGTTSTVKRFHPYSTTQQW